MENMNALACLHRIEREEKLIRQSEHVEGPKAGPKEFSSDTD